MFCPFCGTTVTETSCPHHTETDTEPAHTVHEVHAGSNNNDQLRRSAHKERSHNERISQKAHQRSRAGWHWHEVV